MGAQETRQRIEHIRPITPAYIEHVAFTLAREWMTFDEPIPELKTRFPGKLESCVAQPFQSFGGKTLYPGLVKKAAILYYLLIKNHPFQNGNKRIAITSLFCFLFINDKWLRVEPERLYSFTVFVAGSSPDQKDEMLNIIEDFIDAALTNRRVR